MRTLATSLLAHAVATSVLETSTGATCDDEMQTCEHHCATLPCPQCDDEPDKTDCIAAACYGPCCNGCGQDKDKCCEAHPTDAGCDSVSDCSDKMQGCEHHCAALPCPQCDGKPDKTDCIAAACYGPCVNGCAQAQYKCCEAHPQNIGCNEVLDCSDKLQICKHQCEGTHDWCPACDGKPDKAACIAATCYGPCCDLCAEYENDCCAVHPTDPGCKPSVLV